MYISRFVCFKNIREYYKGFSRVNRFAARFCSTVSGIKGKLEAFLLYKNTRRSRGCGFPITFVQRRISKSSSQQIAEKSIKFQRGPARARRIKGEGCPASKKCIAHVANTRMHSSWSRVCTSACISGSSYVHTPTVEWDRDVDRQREEHREQKERNAVHMCVACVHVCEYICTNENEGERERERNK